MAKKSNKILLFGGLGVVAYLLYRHEQLQAATASAGSGSATLTSSIPQNTTPVPRVASDAAKAASLLSTGTRQSIPTRPVAIVATPAADAATQANLVNAATDGANPGDAVILNWFATGLTAANAAQANKMWPSMTTTEKANLYDLIENDWILGQGNTPARLAFWNSWRTKYHINDGTYK